VTRYRPLGLGTYGQCKVFLWHLVNITEHLCIVKFTTKLIFTEHLRHNYRNKSTETKKNYRNIQYIQTPEMFCKNYRQFETVWYNERTETG
jgi:hypothetical protein